MVRRNQKIYENFTVGSLTCVMWLCHCFKYIFLGSTLAVCSLFLYVYILREYETHFLQIKLHCAIIFVVENVKKHAETMEKLHWKHEKNINGKRYLKKVEEWVKYYQK